MHINTVDFQTPEWVCEFMTRYIVGDVNVVLEPAPGSGNLVRAIKKT